ncbi:peptidoglycan-binding protein [Notoacmeibacter sp. MSK16QG-6]|uniref:peptidoglycan-binding domain-containing protein n=1 Tax=Notoacmeibacter sp. MSK16QG-6 TaxID=2957982 RepID=UPI00209F4607|nr:peptidoglycan-binding protein [Notoacmeibacter sp. MSK16QG-6]MCP1198147.1 peptidoglycan-binding protein [Notoacmeibacter sp. MSK16QG-6]
MRFLSRAGRYGAAFFMANPLLVAMSLAVGAVGIIVTGNSLEQTGRHPSPFFRTLSPPASTAPALAKAPSAVGGQGRTDPAAGDRSVGDPELARIQSVLTDLNLYEGLIDGLEGPRTSAAIRRYQEILGLPQTGQIDNAMRRSLIDPATGQMARSAPPLPKPAPGFYGGDETDDALATGSIGDEDVHAIQQALVNFGFHELTVDGVMGNQTSEALATFQRIEGLAESGQPDEATRGRLKKRGFLR